jgi:hypothetical protein
MDRVALRQAIADGQTHRILDYLALDDWRADLDQGQVPLLRWLVYYDDVLALRLVERELGSLAGLDLDAELIAAAFFGHWRMLRFLLDRGADPQARVAESGETALHAATCKAGRPYYLDVLRMLLAAGTPVAATTIPGSPSDSFMRDVRNRGETALHRAAAFAELASIQLLLDHGADREARDANGDSPLAWASWHLRPGAILEALAFPPHRISPGQCQRLTSDHGQGWGNGMDWNLRGHPPS